MEKRQLDLNAPLLSVRRFSSPSHSTELVVKRNPTSEKPLLPSRQQSLPLCKSEWEFEEVTKPAAVPFHWEQIPGRPKSEVESRAQSPARSSSTPRLPPGRVSEALRRNSGETGKLPPARYNSGERSNDHIVYRPQVEAFALSDHASLLEKLNESLNCNDESDTETGDEAYSDALDTLSQTESWSLNYSVSGLSGYQSSCVKPSGTFSIDTQTREYMMNRFLPAAKAVVLETPQYAVKKPAAVTVEEQPNQVKKKVVSKEQKPLLKQYSVPYDYNQQVDNLESENEDEKTSVPVKKRGKAWGILPRFCVKNSLCLLNPIPGMKSKSHTPTIPSTPQVRRLTRNAHSGPLDKSIFHVPHQKKKFHSGLLSRDHLQEIENHNNKASTIDLNNFLNSRESYRSAVSPLRRYRSGNISPFRNESPKSPFREGTGFLGLPNESYNANYDKIASSRKLFKALQDVSRTPVSERRSGQDVVDTMVETGSVYNKVDLPISKSPHRKSEVLVESDSRRESTDSPPPFKSPLPPPLPKSPSESWLWRTLPSIPLGNPFSASRRRNHIHPKEGHKNDTKWETIVKTSNIRHDHIRYSEELTAHAPH